MGAEAKHRFPIRRVYLAPALLTLKQEGLKVNSLSISYCQPIHHPGRAGAARALPTPAPPWVWEGDGRTPCTPLPTPARLWLAVLGGYGAMRGCTDKGTGNQVQSEGDGGDAGQAESSCPACPWLPCPCPRLGAGAVYRLCRGEGCRAGGHIVAVTPRCAVLFPNCPLAPPPHVLGDPASLSRE